MTPRLGPSATLRMCRHHGPGLVPSVRFCCGFWLIFLHVVILARKCEWAEGLLGQAKQLSNVYLWMSSHGHGMTHVLPSCAWIHELYFAHALLRDMLAQVRQALITDNLRRTLLCARDRPSLPTFGGFPLTRWRATWRNGSLSPISPSCSSSGGSVIKPFQFCGWTRNNMSS